VVDKITLNTDDLLSNLTVEQAREAQERWAAIGRKLLLEPFRLEGHTIYAATAHGASGEAHRIALARLAEPPTELAAIWPDMVDTTTTATAALKRFLDALDRSHREHQADVDAKARALWLRQHRNTGPKPHKRRPPKNLGR
jgi:phage-related protein